MTFEKLRPSNEWVSELMHKLNDVQRRQEVAINKFIGKVKANSESTEAESEKIISNQSKDQK